MTHVHRIRLPEPNGPVVTGRCDCGFERSYSTSGDGPLSFTGGTLPGHKEGARAPGRACEKCGRVCLSQGGLIRHEQVCTGIAKPARAPRGMGRKPGPVARPLAELIHGAGTYRNRGCRCEVCRAGQRDYMNAYNRRKRARAREALTLEEIVALQDAVLGRTG